MAVVRELTCGHVSWHAQRLCSNAVTYCSAYGCCVVHASQQDDNCSSMKRSTCTCI